MVYVLPVLAELYSVLSFSILLQHMHLVEWSLKFPAGWWWFPSWFSVLPSLVLMILIDMFLFCLVTTIKTGKVFFISGLLWRIWISSWIHFLYGGFAGLWVTIRGAIILLLGLFWEDWEKINSDLFTATAFWNFWFIRSRGYSCWRNLSLNSTRYSRFHSFLELIMIPCRAIP